MSCAPPVAVIARGRVRAADRARAGLRAALVGLALALAVPVLVPAAARADGPPNLHVRAAVLIEQSTGERLYGIAPDARLPIASTTKLMTALLTLEHTKNFGAMFTQNDYYPAAVDSQIGLVPGERMSVHDLLLGLMLPSGDDAAEDLAYNVGHGSVGRFIGMMNVRARQLGLRHTHYSTPSGLDTPGNYSSASDLVTLASYDLQHSAFFKRIVALPRAVLHTGNHKRVVINRNVLVGRFPWINGVKTGHTADAGYVLVASATQRGMTLVSAVLGTTSEAARDRNTLALLRYGFGTFHILTPVRAGQVLARPTVRYRPGVHADVIAASGFTDVFAKSRHVRLRVVAPRQLAGPLERHARVGTVTVLAGNRAVARIPLLLADKLPAVSPLTIAARFLTRPFTLVLLAVLLTLVVGLAVVWRWRGRGRQTGRPEPA